MNIKNLHLAWKSLNRHSVLWRAVFHSLLVWGVTLCAITLAAFVVTLQLMQAQVTSSMQMFFPQGLSADSLEQVSLYSNAAAMQLAQFLLAIGVLSLAPIGLLSYIFARNLTGPILDVAGKVRRFQPGAWLYRSTVSTQDEVQLLDQTISDMAGRLQDLYARLSHTVAEKSDKLRHEVAKDHTILAALPIGVLIVNQDGVVSEANAAAATLLQRKEKDLGGYPIVSLLHLKKDSEEVSEANHPILQCLKQNQAISTLADEKMSVVRSDGSFVPVQIHAAPFSAEKKSVGAVVLLADVTAQRKLTDMKNEFIALASHQLRTPLASLHWYLELLTGGDAGPLNEQQESFVAELRLAARRMASVVAGLMDASRLQHGFVDAVKQSVDLNATVLELKNDVGLIAADKKIKCEIHVPNHPIVVQTDPLLLNVVLQNLLSNAVKYSRTESVIDISLYEENKHVKISVQDGGIGIPAADQTRIFEKMFRARNSQALDVNGTGLGLYSSRMIIKTLGGELDFQSEENKGSTFTVTLPKA